MRPKEVVVILVLLIAVAAAIRFPLWPSGSPSAGTASHDADAAVSAPDRVDLLVLIDVSESVALDDIRDSAAMALRYIQNDREVPAHSAFRIAIADRDVERNELDSGNKEPAERYPVQRQNQQKRWANRAGRLTDAVTKYVRANASRKQTCIVDTMKRVPDMFANRPPAMRRRVLFISDMVEDCQNKGDPPSRSEMAERIRQAVDTNKLPGLADIEVFAMVPKRQSRVAIDWVRQPWQAVLKEAGVAEFRIGAPETFLGAPVGR